MAQPPWNKSGPKPDQSAKLSAASIAWARARAKAAGRRYPNLIDNMAATRRQREQESPSRGADPRLEIIANRKPRPEG